MGNVYPLHGTVERTGEFQHGELKRMMPGVKKVSVAAYRVPVQRGHLAGYRATHPTQLELAALTRH